MKEQRPLPPSIEELRGVIAAICAARPIARVDAFGSVAKKTTYPGSDVDLLIEFSPGTHPGLFEMGALKEDIEEQLGMIYRSFEPACSRTKQESLSA